MKKYGGSEFFFRKIKRYTITGADINKEAPAIGNEYEYARLTLDGELLKQVRVAISHDQKIAATTPEDDVQVDIMLQSSFFMTLLRRIVVMATFVGSIGLATLFALISLYIAKLLLPQGVVDSILYIIGGAGGVVGGVVIILGVGLALAVFPRIFSRDKNRVISLYINGEDVDKEGKEDHPIAVFFAFNLLRAFG